MSVPSANVEPPVAPLPVLGHLSSRWSPPEGSTITTHTGAPLAPDLVFIAAPPMEDIGELLSAHSTVREKGGELWLWHRIGWGICCGFLGVVFFAYIANKALGVPYGLPLVSISAIIGAIPALLFGAPPNTTTYVGTQGAARYIWGGKNNPIKSAQVAPFAQVNGSNVQQTRHYTNGIYTGTDYAFLWGRVDAAGKPHKLLEVSGRFYRSKGPRDNDEAFHFGAAVEQAYTAFRMIQLRELLRAGGSEPFSVGANGKLILSAAGLQVALGSKQEFIPREQITGLGIHEGMVTITRAGAKKGILGIGSEGIFTVAYSELASPRLFLALLAHVVGQGVPHEGDETAPEPSTTG